MVRSDRDVLELSGPLYDGHYEYLKRASLLGREPREQRSARALRAGRAVRRSRRCSPDSLSSSTSVTLESDTAFTTSWYGTRPTARSPSSATAVPTTTVLR